MNLPTNDAFIKTLEEQIRIQGFCQNVFTFGAMFCMGCTNTECKHCIEPGVTIAIIPARANSKRISGKNIRDFNGNPIIAYAIETALKSKLFSDVVVSTDSIEIKEISEHYGASVPFMRKPSMSGDYVTVTDVVRDVISTYEIFTKSRVGIACCIFPTTPLLTPDHLQEGYEIISSTRPSYVFAATKIDSRYIRAFTKTYNATKIVTEEYINSRTQDLPPLYVDAGQFYFGLRSSWLTKKPIISGNSNIIDVSDLGIVDIDTEEDWVKMEKMVRGL